MTEPQADSEILKKIFEAERRADRIVREGEAQARALLEEADRAAREILESGRRDAAALRAEALAAGIRKAEEEGRAAVEAAGRAAQGWTRDRRPRIDGVALSLLARVLPR